MLFIKFTHLCNPPRSHLKRTRLTCMNPDAWEKGPLNLLTHCDLNWYFHFCFIISDADESIFSIELFLMLVVLHWHREIPSTTFKWRHLFMVNTAPGIYAGLGWQNMSTVYIWDRHLKVQKYCYTIVVLATWPLSRLATIQCSNPDVVCKACWAADRNSGSRRSGGCSAHLDRR